MAERRRQAGGEGRGRGTHTNVHTQTEIRMQSPVETCMGMYAYTRNANMLMSYVQMCSLSTHIHKDKKNFTHCTNLLTHADTILIKIIDVPQ